VANIAYYYMYGVCMSKEKVAYVKAPKDIAKALKGAKAISDFLPPPEDLVL
jgi:hypothetical protein